MLWAYALGRAYGRLGAERGNPARPIYDEPDGWKLAAFHAGFTDGWHEIIREET